MKRLSKKAKIQLLERAKEILLNHNTGYICRAIEKAANFSGSKFFEIDYIDVFHYIPELLKYRPKKLYSSILEEVWFPPAETKKRVDIINKVIKDIQRSKNIK